MAEGGAGEGVGEGEEGMMEGMMDEVRLLGDGTPVLWEGAGWYIPVKVLGVGTGFVRPRGLADMDKSEKYTRIEEGEARLVCTAVELRAARVERYGDGLS